MAFQDLSQQMNPNMLVWPGDPQPEFKVSCTFEEGNCRSTLVSFTTHTGTHVDAFSHIVPEGAPMDQIPLDHFFGTATIIDCTGLAPNAEINIDLVENHPEIKNASILLFRTGWDKYFNTDAYADGFPAISVDLAQWMVDHKIKAVGVDCYSVDPTTSFAMPSHQILMRGDVVIYENLCNLDKIDASTFEFYGLPICFTGLDASPVRCLARW
ncbi:cyclase family protein [Chakrabartyella piscis]|uniref:cyclase family protein n=1 Tax=Chakrabartyella piscis TaxID=2918914 RepID=UPI002958DD2C|nr:cyclase family protein [Chakrabartyella piscis]